MWLLWIVQFLFIPTILTQGQNIFDDLDVSQLRLCPFPRPKSLPLGCSCLVDGNYKSYLVCDMPPGQDFSEEYLQIITDSFACKLDGIDFFLMNGNGGQWNLNISESFGQFNLVHFEVKNVTKFVGNIDAAGLNSSSRIREFIIHDSRDGPQANIVKTGAFNGLKSLKKINLGNNFEVIESNSFKQLPTLENISFQKKSVKSLARSSFDDISLKSLDFSDQNIDALPSGLFGSLPNITSISFARNQIEKILDDTFSLSPNLVFLDLSRNSIKNVGNNIKYMENKNFVIDLSENQIEFLTESSFKPFVEQRRKDGYINLSDNPMQCGCDTLWLATSNFLWRNLIRNTSCSDDGESIEKIDSKLLEKFCPTEHETCPGYNFAEGRTKDAGGILISSQDPSGRGRRSAATIETNLVITSDKNDIWLRKGQYAAFLVGGGGYGDKGHTGASSGFFSLHNLTVTQLWENVHIDIGFGGSSGHSDGYPTSLTINETLYMANGGGGNNGAGWSGGGDESHHGASNGGTSNAGSGSGEALPSLPGVTLAPGQGGTTTSGEGGGGGGVVINGSSPSRRHVIDGVGYGAGGGEWNSNGYPGVAVIVLLD